MKTNILIIIILLFTATSLLGFELYDEEIGFAIELPDDWEGGFSEEIWGHIYSSPEENLYVILGSVSKGDLAYAERSELIEKGLMDMGLNFNIEEKEELEINALPISIGYGYSDFAEEDFGGSVMLIELTDSSAMALLIVLGDEDGWTQYEDDVTDIYISMEERSEY